MCEEEEQKESIELNEAEALIGSSVGSTTTLREMKPKNEVFDTYNGTFSDDDIKTDPFDVDPSDNTTTEQDPSEFVVGEHSWRNGKPANYTMYTEQLWKQMLRFIQNRIEVAKGTACLINVRTMSKWIVENGNIKSMTTVEGEALDLFTKRFGVKDDQGKEPLDNGFEDIRETMKFWGTLGSRGAEGKKRRARVYQITNVDRLIKYIEENV